MVRRDLESLHQSGEQALTSQQTMVSPMRKLGFLSCFFPAYNEESNIESVLNEIVTVAPQIAIRWEALVIDELSLQEAKTKPMAAILKALKLDGATCLVGTAGHDPAIYKSARNIDGVQVMPAAEFNAYAVLRQKRLVLTRAALDELRKNNKAKAGAPA